MRRQIIAATSLLLCALVALAVAGCEGPDVRFIPAGGSYTVQEVQEHARSVRLDGKQISGSESENARRDALVSLRRQGDAGIEAAEVLTATFPSRDGGVPLYVEGATVEGTTAWIVIEAAPGRDSRLSKHRLWVLDRETGKVVSSAVLR